MNQPHFFFVAAFVVVGIGVSLTPARAQGQYGGPTTRHCQTDYDHRAHTYGSGSHYHYCPGGAHQHYGGSRYGGSRRRSAYDPLVAQVQAILVQKDLYHHVHHNQVDGIYGEETKHAVQDFQRLVGLPATGMIDPATQQALGIQGGPPGLVPVALQSVQGVPVVRSPAEGGVSSDESGDVLTPAEAAQLMKVSEDDVVELLESGDLVGKKIGENWRIFRQAVEDFFRSEAKVQQPKKAEEKHEHKHEDGKPHAH